MVEIERERTIFDGFVKIDEAVLRHKRYDGAWTEPLTRIKVERGDSAAAIVSNAGTGKIVLVEQFRYPTLAGSSGWIVETVAGIVGRGERPEHAIEREIREEIGYRPRSLERIAEFYVSPGASSERIFLYWAEVVDDDRVDRVVGDDEDITLREYTPAELWSALDAGQLTDAKTIIAVTWLRARLG